jgi:cell division cycle 20-like protein 1 (cofactor of APC complex)
MGEQEQGPEQPIMAVASTTVSTSEVVGNVALNMASPPASKTPPSHPVKKTLFFPDNLGSQSQSRPGSEPVDPESLARALKDYDEAGRRRERTPGTSPSRKRQRVYGDR